MEKTLNFQRLSRLTSAARRRFNDVMLGWDCEPEINSGVCQLWSVNKNQLFLLTRVEQSELVVVGAAGRDLITACIYLLAAAKLQKLKTIRYHTIKPALARLIKKHFPFQLIENRQNGEMVLRMVI